MNICNCVLLSETAALCWNTETDFRCINLSSWNTVVMTAKNLVGCFQVYWNVSIAMTRRHPKSSRRFCVQRSLNHEEQKTAWQGLGICSRVLGLSQIAVETTEMQFLKAKSSKRTVKLCVASNKVPWYPQGKNHIFSIFSWHVLCSNAIRIKQSHSKRRFAYGTLEGKNWQNANPHKDKSPQRFFT